MCKIFGFMLLAAGASVFAMGAQPAPEISADSAGSAVALIAGALVVYRGRRK
jgi:hypothetical protein